MSQRMTLGAKLTAGFGAMMLLTLAVSVGAITVISQIGGDMDYAVNRAGKRNSLAWQMNHASTRAMAAERGILLRSIVQQTAGVDRHKQEFREASQEIERALGEIQPLIDDDSTRSSVDSMRTRFQALNQAHNELLQAIDKQQFDQVQKISDEKVQPRVQEITAEAGALLARQTEAANQATARAGNRAGGAYWIIGSLIAISAIVAVFLWFMVRKSSTTLQALAQEMSSGAGEVAQAASQVAEASQSLAQAASEQAATLEETAASSQHLAGMTRSNLEHTQGATESVAVADRQIAGANQTLELMVSSMQEITASSGKISRIIKVIDEIAFQTNILALNAAVEAARAGEAGMGFAVVADEVRNLAQRCAQAAKDTAELIEDSIEKSNGGQTKLGEVVQAIKAITESSSSIRSLVDKVNLSSRDQSRSIEQISTSVNQMQRVTQSTAASAEQSAAASQEMSAQAEGMRTAVDRLHQLVGGSEHVSGRAIGGRRGGSSPAPSSSSPSRTARTSSKQLDNLRQAVAPRSSNAPAAVADPFPMDEEFREF